jgi:hypothetical protein
MKKKKAKRKVYSYNPIIDLMIQAKKPGRRRSANGNIYYEYRQNRSDKGRWI